jgi:hypothetical protein
VKPSRLSFESIDACRRYCNNSQRTEREVRPLNCCSHLPLQLTFATKYSYVMSRRDAIRELVTSYRSQIVSNSIFVLDYRRSVRGRDSHFSNRRLSQFRISERRAPRPRHLYDHERLSFPPSAPSVFVDHSCVCKQCTFRI